MSATGSYPVATPLPFCKVANQRFLTPTSCYEAKDPSPKVNLQTATLYAEGMTKLSQQLYPEELNVVVLAFMPYDEPLYPIPVGASVFYYVLLAWLITFYFTYLGRKVFANVKKKLDLHPDAIKFPSLPLYWIQQSKREAELRREVRNTWAWLARRYLLSPNDPLLANVDQVLGLVNWHDFEVSRTTWSLIKVILTVNALYVKVKKDREVTGGKTFEIVKDTDLAARMSTARVNEHIQDTRVFEDIDGTKPRTKKARVIDAIFASADAWPKPPSPDKNEPKVEPEKPKKLSNESNDLRIIDSLLQTTTPVQKVDGKKAPKTKAKKGKSVQLADTVSVSLLPSPSETVTEAESDPEPPVTSMFRSDIETVDNETKMEPDATTLPVEETVPPSSSVSRVQSEIVTPSERRGVRNKKLKKQAAKETAKSLAPSNIKTEKVKLEMDPAASTLPVEETTVPPSSPVSRVQSEIVTPDNQKGVLRNKSKKKLAKKTVSVKPLAPSNTETATVETENTDTDYSTVENEDTTTTVQSETDNQSTIRKRRRRKRKKKKKKPETKKWDPFFN